MWLCAIVKSYDRHWFLTVRHWHFVTWWQQWDTLASHSIRRDRHWHLDSSESNTAIQSWPEPRGLTNGSQLLKPSPSPLEKHDLQAAEKWKKFKFTWVNYSLVTKLESRSSLGSNIAHRHQERSMGSFFYITVWHGWWQRKDQTCAR